MKILFLTQYCPPEVGAPQNRIFEFAKQLKKFGHEVTILTLCQITLKVKYLMVIRERK